MAMLEKQNEMYLTNLQKEEERAQQGQAEREAMQEEVERVAAALEQTRSRELECREKTQVLRAALTKSEMEKESLVKELALLQERVSERDTAEPCTQDVGAERKQLSQLSVTNLEQQRVSTSEEENRERRELSAESRRSPEQEESHAHCSQQLPELQEQAPTQELSARQDSNNFLLQQEEQCQEGQQNLDKLGEKDKTSDSPPKYLQSLEEEIRRLTVCLEEKDQRIRALEEKDLAQQNEVSELRSALHQMEQLLSDRTGEVQELKHQVLLEKQRDKLDAIENLFHIWKGIRQGSQQVQEALVKTEREMGQIQALQEAVLEKETAQATQEQQLLQALEELGAALGTAEHRRDSPEAALKEEASAKKKVAGIVHQVVESLQRKLKSREEQRQDVLDVGAERKQLSQLSVTNLEQQRVSTSEEENRERRELSAESRRSPEQEESHAHCSQQLPELQEQAPTQELSARQDSNNFLLQQEEQCQEGQQNLEKLGEKDKTSSSPPKYLQSLEEEIRRLTVCLEEKDRRIRALEEKDLAQQNEVSELRSALHQMEQLLSDRTGEVQELKHQVLLEKQRDKLDAIENLFHIWKGIRQGSQQVREALVKTEREMGQIQALQEAVLEKETAQATQEQQLLQALEELGAALGTAEHRRDSPEAALKEEASAKKKVAGIVHQVVESLQRKLKSREEQRQDVLVQPEERRIKRVFKRVFPPDSIVFYDENNRRLMVPTYGKVQAFVRAGVRGCVCPDSRYCGAPDGSDSVGLSELGLVSLSGVP
ncbi:golgin subfamily A member 6-like protein 22 [Pithys albifrons albifrons]|uniref:golgin subfamily A member 6-like protein 22 n=1 Tax=Pithys albifrons albifrons TaxID=3385563 RepID=UPI003A5CB86F